MAAVMRLTITIVLGLLGACQRTTLAQESESVVAPPLSVMTFNIRYGTAGDGPDAWTHRRDLVADIIRRHDPDVVGVQEALRFQLDFLLEQLPDYAYCGVGRSDGAEAGEFAAVLFRTDRMELIEQKTFWFSETPEAPGSTSWGNRIPRICTRALLRDRATDASFVLFNVHLDHQSQPSRYRSIQLLRERMASWIAVPVIVTGDFNAGESSEEMRLLRDGRPGTRDMPFVDTFRVRRPDADAVGTFNGFAGTRTGEKIDGIFARPDCTVLSAAILHDERDGRYPSDHFPVTATIRLATDR